MRFLLKLGLAWIILTVAQMIAGFLIPVTAPFAPNTFFWLLISNAVIVTALAMAASRSGWSGLFLGLSLFALPVAIATMNMVEGIVFLRNAGIDWTRIYPGVLLSYALAAPLWTLLLRSKQPTQEPRWSFRPQTLPGKVWRFAVCDCVYLVLYYTAGTIIFPYVRDFYMTQRLPSAVEIVSLQLLLRGPVFVLLCLLLTRMVRVTGTRQAWLVALAFTMLSGVAPLLIPNPYLPDAARWVHFGEVTVSNFLFGFFVAWLWAPGIAAAHRSTHQVA